MVCLGSSETRQEHRDLSMSLLIEPAKRRESLSLLNAYACERSGASARLMLFLSVKSKFHSPSSTKACTRLHRLGCYGIGCSVVFPSSSVAVHFRACFREIAAFLPIASPLLVRNRLWRRTDPDLLSRCVSEET